MGAFAICSTAVAASGDAEEKTEKKNAQRQAKVAKAVASAVQATVSDNKQSPFGTLPVLHVSLSGVSDEKQLANVKAFLDIYNENGKPIKNASYTRYLANVGVEQIQQSLQPFGYYLATVDADIDESATQWNVSYRIQRGEPVRLRKHAITIEGEGKTLPDFIALVQQYPLQQGDILNQERYTDFKNDVLGVATSKGFFDGDFSQKQIVLSDDFLAADILLTYDTGQRYTFGDTTLKQDFLDQDFIDRYKTFKSGEVYSSSDIANLQRDLYNSGYVKVIDVDATPDSEHKRVPVTLSITPKKNKKHTFGIGYGTDSGARGHYDFDWRWVNRRGHKFKSEIFASQKEFKTGVAYTIPGSRPAHDNYRLFSNFDRKWGDNDKESTLWNVGVAYKDINGNLAREFGVKWQQEDFSIGNDSGNIGLLTPYARFLYTKKDNPLQIKDGLYAEGYFTAASDTLLSDVSLFQAIGNAKYIKTFADVNRVKFMAGAGRTWTHDFHKLPVAYRFFTGGDKTIRGYKFEAIGDRDSSHTNVGGNKMYYLSAEYEYFFKKNMAAAAFVDAGDAYSEDSSKLKVGAGLGFHYYSPIGPIKVDVAHGFDNSGGKVRLHLSIGPEF